MLWKHCYRNGPMPQAAEDLRKEWGEGKNTDQKAVKFLESKGYKRTRAWTWVKPSMDHRPSEEEIRAICYLIDEWDFGGFVEL